MDVCTHDGDTRPTSSPVHTFQYLLDDPSDLMTRKMSWPALVDETASRADKVKSGLQRTAPDTPTVAIMERLKQSNAEHESCVS